MLPIWQAHHGYQEIIMWALMQTSQFLVTRLLRIVLEMMGQKTTEEEIFRMIAEADAENTGKITYT